MTEIRILMRPRVLWSPGQLPGQVTQLADHGANWVRQSACQRRACRTIGRPAGKPHIIKSTGVDAATDETGVLSKFIRCLNRPQTRIQMRDLVETGIGNRLPHPVTQAEALLSREQRTLLQVSQFLRRELPVRFAHRARELDSIDGLSETKGIRTIIGFYEQSFRDVVGLAMPTTMVEEERFCAVVGQIHQRESGTNVQIAKGLAELRQARGYTYEDLADKAEIHDAISAFYLHRIGIRVLIGHYLDLHEHRPGVVGSIENAYAGKTSPDRAALPCRGYGGVLGVLARWSARPAVSRARAFRQDCTRRCSRCAVRTPPPLLPHLCRLGLAPATSAPGPGLMPPALHWDWAPLSHVCATTDWAAACAARHSCDE